ncbi:unnamed protein product [Ixodes persulcatus]
MPLNLYSSEMQFQGHFLHGDIVPVCFLFVRHLKSTALRKRRCYSYARE